MSEPFKVLSAKDLFDREDAARRRMRIVIDAKHLTLHVNTESGHKLYGSDGYFVPRERVSTPIKLLSFVHHLGEKDWFGGYEAHRLIEAVARKNGWDLY